ncbi:MAG TPA: hypothetical protein VGO43_08110 [Pyrinomonadaceae bacterium]|jgi:hypothetical protein|nr:hypothetical protein [Pyrinomonadaceae bacterium]
MKLRFRYGILAGLFLAIFSLYPQGKLIYNRGYADWNGHYAYNDIDEVAYAAYVKALIDGRPRKNDPYTGRDDSPTDLQPESLFSIQFAGPYTIALPARMLGVDAPWAMTISGAVAAFLTALAVFWLIGMLTDDSLFALAGSLVVLAGGALFAGEGAIGEILGSGYSYPYFPGFRRYIPAMAFPAFFLLVGVVWKAVGSEQRRIDDGQGESPHAAIGTPYLAAAIAVLAFAYTVYTYFYVWTTAAAWLGCFTLLVFAIRPASWWRDLKWLAVLGAGCVASVLPYFYLLSKRSHTMDEVQMLVLTHKPDLTRVPELIGFVVLGVIAAAIAMKVLALKDRSTLFAASLALTPALVFNQQLITGQQLQPIHYQVFIGNYVAGLSLVVTLGLMWKRSGSFATTPARIAVAMLAVIAAAWGFVECHYTVRILDDVNIARDEAFPIGRRLAELARNDPDPHHSTVLYLPIAEADDLPTLAPQPVLWARHQHVFAGVSWQENKERYYQQLYYLGVTPAQLAERMKQGEDFVSIIALFGWGRHTDRLNSEWKPLSFREIDEEAANNGRYLTRFDARGANAVPLSYLVAASDQEESTFSNLDKWYERYDRELWGKYVLYKLRLR